jgi:hypothetical protein
MLFDNHRGPGMNGDASPVVVVPEPAIVNDNDGSVPAAQWAPAVIVAVPEPIDPGRGPVVTGIPMPTIVSVPMPPAVMMGKVTPWVIRDPGVSVKRCPYPAAVVIGAPGRTDIIGDPDVFPVGGVINPSPVPGQLIFIVFITAGQVAGRIVASIPHHTVSFLVPTIKSIGIGRVKIIGVFPDPSVIHNDFLIFPYITAVVLS